MVTLLAPDGDERPCGAYMSEQQDGYLRTFVSNERTCGQAFKYRKVKVKEESFGSCDNLYLAISVISVLD